ncbi:MAG: DUF1080 domain-containing protein [Saprospiraceae bacterium]|nr:DUF1080 domain-containing protein [Saprospiraceae bacterium]
MEITTRVFHGYQIEIDPSPRAWSGGLYDESRRGWLYKLEGKPEAQKLLKNQYGITTRSLPLDNTIRVWINGTLITDFNDGENKKRLHWPSNCIALEMMKQKE